MRLFLSLQEVFMKEECGHTYLKLSDRSRLTLDGVSNVISFDEEYLTLDITDGRLNVEGQGLRIESLSREMGEIEIIGRISGIFYSDVKKGRREGKGLFK